MSTMRGMRNPVSDASRSAVVAYAAGWLLAVAAAVGIVFAIFGREQFETVGVPPVRETQLTDAAGHGRCVLHMAKRGERLNPPVDGPAGVPPARPGFYDKPISALQLSAAVRHGIVVIQFRDGLEGKRLEHLKTLQAAVPEGTIVAPNATGMRFELAVTAYRRLLGCPRFSDQSLDAVQLFRGRYLGSGPESHA
ncbi:MAG TPA: DUF3105 domain-containing protein [Solirubrobacter sp.]|jgi:hypothetical protein|nr:DUF3105 domain-containing protein [Solirubrobacter sp.]